MNQSDGKRKVWRKKGVKGGGGCVIALVCMPANKLSVADRGSRMVYSGRKLLLVMSKKCCQTTHKQIFMLPLKCSCKFECVF